ncbi:hypothetical protein P7K49_030895 [Saguinus oedipus]|uniref:Anaphase-promoting complex subunit 13 n=1 Tax=Saguinus oedipus TaxID=9490 RepID=A0ABQ9U476_SAGOE|nr:hypothetical protein P7K49_030895 [Saguinus oedipus]
MLGPLWKPLFCSLGLDVPALVQTLGVGLKWDMEDLLEVPPYFSGPKVILRRYLCAKPSTKPYGTSGAKPGIKRKMDSEVQRDGRILDLIDDAWREDKLPYEDVAIPLNELPEPEQDNGGTTESVKEQEMKWTDLALQYLHENVPPIGN